MGEFHRGFYAVQLPFRICFARKRFGRAPVIICAIFDETKCYAFFTKDDLFDKVQLISLRQNIAGGQCCVIERFNCQTFAQLCEDGGDIKSRTAKAANLFLK